MIEEMMLWCWDARPHPAFPARADVWADGASWRRGHWLNGRAGLSELGEVVSDLCLRAGVTETDATSLLGAVSGYVVDAPATARAALEPLMAAYAFNAAERDGQIVFVHSAADAAVTVDIGELVAPSDAEAFAQRGDPAEIPIEARVRFLDPTRDYLIGNVSARRLDRAEGGVISVDAPLVLEAEAAEAIAQRLLSDQRAAHEAAQLDLGPAHLALEPGDVIEIADRAGAYQIMRIEDAEGRRVELQRAAPETPSQSDLAAPNAPPIVVAPTPVLAVLDLPPLPGAESDERPLAGAFASPWLGAHPIYAGASETLRATTNQPAIIGELLWALWPGPVDRWDDGNRVHIKLYGGVLASATADAVLNGANVFAIESEGGEWELVQARGCVLTAPHEYELSGFLRGRLGSAHAMLAPHPVGARVVVLDAKLARLDVGAHEWNETLRIVAPPAGAPSSSNRAAQLDVALPHAATRPWAPSHVRAERDAAGDLSISWKRCARMGGDAWGPGEPPLGAAVESCRVDILDGADIVRTFNAAIPSCVYAAADQVADFGAPPASLRIWVA